jgi:hypothetical protein
MLPHFGATAAEFGGDVRAMHRRDGTTLAPAAAMRASLLSILSALLPCALGAFTAACSVEEPTSGDDSDRNLLVRINRGADQSVSFHALSAGAVAITQTGSDKAFPLELSDDPLLAFQQAAPDHAVPEVLAAAARVPEVGALSVSVESLVPDEPVILELEAPVVSHAFPPSSFICWARNRYSCLYNLTSYEEIGRNGAPAPQTLNSVWAVDRDMVPISLHVHFSNPADSGVWQYEVWDGQWRTWSLSASFAILGYSNRRINNPTLLRPNARFHYSAAGAQ